MADLPANARYCVKCQKFQTIFDRIISGIDIAAVVSLVPLLALVFVFLQDKILFSGSDVNAALVSCAANSVVVALSNAGARAAVVEGGTAERIVDGKTDSHRSLRPHGKSEMPLVVAAGYADAVRFDMVLPGDIERALPMPPSSANTQCEYDVRISVIDFGGRRDKKQLKRCKCST
jgi:hypothetical protein